MNVFRLFLLLSINSFSHFRIGQKVSFGEGAYCFNSDKEILLFQERCLMKIDWRLLKSVFRTTLLISNFFTHFLSHHGNHEKECHKSASHVDWYPTFVQFLYNLLLSYVNSFYKQATKDKAMCIVLQHLYWSTFLIIIHFKKWH